MARSLPHSHVELDARQARQGAWGQPVFIVLLVSVIAAAIALLAVWAYHARSLQAVEINNGHRLARFAVPAAAPRQTAATPAPTGQPASPPPQQ